MAGGRANGEASNTIRPTKVKTWEKKAEEGDGKKHQLNKNLTTFLPGKGHPKE